MTAHPIHNPERRNPHRLAREAERRAAVEASLQRVAAEIETADAVPEHDYDLEGASFAALWSTVLCGVVEGGAWIRS